MLQPKPLKQQIDADEFIRCDDDDDDGGGNDGICFHVKYIK